MAVWFILSFSRISVIFSEGKPKKPLSGEEELFFNQQVPQPAYLPFHKVKQVREYIPKKMVQIVTINPVVPDDELRSDEMSESNIGEWTRYLCDQVIPLLQHFYEKLFAREKALVLHLSSKNCIFLAIGLNLVPTERPDRNYRRNI